MGKVKYSKLVVGPGACNTCALRCRAQDADGCVAQALGISRCPENINMVYTTGVPGLSRIVTPLAKVLRCRNLKMGVLRYRREMLKWVK